MITERMRQAAVRDLERLYAEIPELIAAVQAGDEQKTNEAIALVTKGSSGRMQFLMGQLTDMVLDECKKGNSLQLRMVASGAAFR